VVGKAKRVSYAQYKFSENLAGFKIIKQDFHDAVSQHPVALDIKICFSFHHRPLCIKDGGEN
jgi:hypothetical protein